MKFWKMKDIMNGMMNLLTGQNMQNLDRMESLTSTKLLNSWKKKNMIWMRTKPVNGLKITQI